MNRDSPGRAGFLRRIQSESSGAVLAVIINDDGGELTRIILCGERAHSLRDGSGFIARRDDSDDARPACESLWLVIVFAQLPEVAPREKKINPDRQRNRGDESRWQRHALFCNKPGSQRYARSSARMGSRRMRFPVAAKMALHMAGATTGKPGSTMPAGSSLLITT